MSDKFNIKMTETLKACDNGFTVKEFVDGETYVIGKSLYNSFKNMGACELVEEKKPVKKKTPVKENKSVKLVVEDK